MNINDAYPSNYLKASDLHGRTIQVIIDRVEMETVGKDHKAVLYFQNKTKGMILNKTNANNIAAIYSPETDDWIGQPLVLFEAMVDFKGQTVPALRVRGPMPKDNPKTLAPSYPPARKVGGMSDAAMDDSIPF